MTIRNPKDFLSGLMFIGFGTFFLAWSVTRYELGTGLQMGPAFFPALLGAVLALLGVLVAGRALVIVGTSISRFRARQILLVLGAIVAYGYLLRPLGLLATTIVLVVIASLGGHEFRAKEALWLGVSMAAISVVLFVKVLSLPFPLCPRPFNDACVRAVKFEAAQPTDIKRMRK